MQVRLPLGGGNLSLQELFQKNLSKIFNGKDGIIRNMLKRKPTHNFPSYEYINFSIIEAYILLHFIFSEIIAVVYLEIIHSS